MYDPYSSLGNNAAEAVNGVEDCVPRLFSFYGRIGRLRHLGYSLALTVMLWGLMLAISIVMTRRRLNDLDHSGWFCLLALVPFVNVPFMLYLLFGRGTEGKTVMGWNPHRTPITCSCIA